MMGTDVPVVYTHDGYEQLGILHQPDTPSSIGVIIVPAGYQYRIGPYRQHVLLARAFGKAGISSFRFDPPAIGDSDGTFLDFEIGGALEAAIEAYFVHYPGLEGVVLWGICGSASVVAMHVPQSNPHIKGLILVNPWVRSQETLAKAYLKHYYLRKLTDRMFLKKLISGRIRVGKSIESFLKITRSALTRPQKSYNPNQSSSAIGSNCTTEELLVQPLSERMVNRLESFSGKTLIVLSGNDLTAQEFLEATAAAPRWRKLLNSSSCRRFNVPDADHIFSEPEVLQRIIEEIIKWIKALEDAAPPSTSPYPAAVTPT